MLRLRSVLGYVIIVSSVGMSMLPVAWFTLSAFRERAAITAYPPSLFGGFTMANFSALLEEHRLGHTFINGLLAASGCMVLTSLLAVPLARTLLYASQRARRTTLLSLLSVRLVPPIAISLPLFIVFSRLGIRGELWGLALVDSVAVLPLAAWLMFVFTAAVPIELEWSGQLDGLSHEASYWRIVLPSAAPGIAVTAAFSFIFAWNDYLIAILLTDADSLTLTASLPVLVTQGITQWGQVAAATIVGMVPVAGLAAILGRYFVAGITSGVVKKL